MHRRSRVPASWLLLLLPLVLMGEVAGSHAASSSSAAATAESLEAELAAGWRREGVTPPAVEHDAAGLVKAARPQPRRSGSDAVSERRRLQQAVELYNAAVPHGVSAKAETLLRKAVAECPRVSNAWNNLATIYQRRGDVELALYCAERAVATYEEGVGGAGAAAAAAGSAAAEQLAMLYGNLANVAVMDAQAKQQRQQEAPAVRALHVAGAAYLRAVDLLAAAAHDEEEERMRKEKKGGGGSKKKNNKQQRGEAPEGGGARRQAAALVEAAAAALVRALHVDAHTQNPRSARLAAEYLSGRAGETRRRVAAFDADAAALAAEALSLVGGGGGGADDAGGASGSGGDDDDAAAAAAAAYAAGNFAAAAQSAEASLAARPEEPTVLYLLASCLSVMGHLDDAVSAYGRVVSALLARRRRRPGQLLPAREATTLALAAVERANQRQRLCDFSYTARGFVQLRRLLRHELAAAATTLPPRPPSQSPFSLLTYPHDPLDLRRAAEAAHSVFSRAGGGGVPLYTLRRLRRSAAARRVLRVGVVTADAGDTNVGRDLLGWLRQAAWLEERAKASGGDGAGAWRVELVLFALRPLDKSAWGRATEEALPAGRLVELPGEAAEAADAVARERVHVLVNLNGFTKNHNHALWHLRPAPVALNYKGCPMTYGAPRVVQHTVGDARITPLSSAEALYSERLLVLPRTFFVTSYPLVWPEGISAAAAAAGRHAASERAPPFAADEFVFCCFNHLNKVTQQMVDVWASILLRSEAAGVRARLWLLRLPDGAAQRLERELEARGVDAARVVAASRLFPLRDHLAVKERCDLFLDTEGFNAHGTATDALWAGIPLLTLRGAVYHSRVAAAHAACHNLSSAYAASSFRGYEDAAVEAAQAGRGGSARFRRPDRRGARHSPVFDTRAWVADFARAAQLLWRMHALFGDAVVEEESEGGGGVKREGRRRKGHHLLPLPLPTYPKDTEHYLPYAERLHSQ